jgi:hypothetical protein
MDLELQGEMWFWKGPSPWHFVSVPDDAAAALESASAVVSYGWGMVPVVARIGNTTWSTSLWPKDGGYIVPIRATVRKAERIDVGDTVTVRLTVDV